MARLLGASQRAAFDRLPAQVRGALWMCVAVPCFASMINIVRVLGETQHPLEIVFFRNLFGLLALVLCSRIPGRQSLPPPNRPHYDHPR